MSEHSGNKYIRTIRGRGSNGGSVEGDVYNVLEAFEVTCPATAHAVKKLLCAGIRGKGDRMQDLCEANDALLRAVELERQRVQFEAKEQRESVGLE